MIGITLKLLFFLATTQSPNSKKGSVPLGVANANLKRLTHNKKEKEKEKR